MPIIEGRQSMCMEDNHRLDYACTGGHARPLGTYSS